MILKRIIVSNWRSLLDDVEVGPFSEGLNVIHAPNGTGKSSLFEAMRRGLFDAYHVSGGDIAAVQPWGRDLTPSVAIEFIEGDDTWRVEKAFLSGKSAKLFRFEGGTFKPVADGRNADERIREILSAEAPGRGLSKQEHWGLAQILWAPQGELHLHKISGNAAERLKSALGIQMSGESGGQIEDRIEEKYLQFFTRKGSFKGGKNAAPLVLLQERETVLAQQLTAIREKHLAFEQAGNDVEDARQRRLQARREADALRDTVTKTRAYAEAYAKLKSEQSNKREAEALAKEKYDSLNSRQQQIQQAREQIATLSKSAEEQTSALTGLQKEEQQAKEALATQRTAQENARAKRSQLAERQKTIESARDYLKQRDSFESLIKRLAQVTELTAKKDKASQALEEILAPSVKVIRDLRKWISQRDQAIVALKASQIHLTITPEKDIVVESATGSADSKVKAGQSFELSGDDWVDVSVADFGSIRASGPKGNADIHRAELEQSKQKIEMLTQPYGTGDPEKLQELRDRADKLAQDVHALQERIEDVLAGDELDALKQAKAELHARISETEKQFTDWVKQVPSLSALQSEFETFRQGIEDVITAAENAYEKAQARHIAADKAVSEAQAELKVVQGQVDSLQRQLSELSRDNFSDDERAKAINEALMSWQAAKASAEKAEQDLKQFPDDPRKELDKLEKQLTALEDAESKARDEEKTSEGQLQSLAADGTYSKLVAAEEELATIKADMEQESIRMDAIQLLHDTVSNCKSRMVASVSAPVSRSATHMLSRIVGPRLGQLQLTGDFVPDAVSPEIATSPVALNNLSGGEQEQIYLVARLALADVLAKDQRQLVVLDDVLNATDAGRLARLLALMEEVADRLQIIILTCHPERYRALDGAEFFELK